MNYNIHKNLGNHLKNIQLMELVYNYLEVDYLIHLDLYLVIL